MVKNEFGRREREFIKRFCKRTFGYFTPHFYRLLLIIGLLLLFLVWFSKNYALSYTEEIEGIEALPKVEMQGIPGDTSIQAYCATDKNCREHRWNEIKEINFSDKTFVDIDKNSWLLTPTRAPDGAFVPINFGTHRKNVKFAHLVIDMNPVPAGSWFDFRDSLLTNIDFSIRVRLESYSNIRIIFETDTHYYQVTNFVKASGGCAAPPLGDIDSFYKTAGKIRTKIRDDRITVSVLHPQFNGLQMNPVTTEYIEPFYVQKVNVSAKCQDKLCKLNHNIFVFHGDISTSQNPTFSFKFSELDFEFKSVDFINIEVEDSDDNVYKRTEQIL